jgi:hypothetical protein
VTDVQWGRHCWRDRWGRLHCQAVGGVVAAGGIAGP